MHAPRTQFALRYSQAPHTAFARLRKSFHAPSSIAFFLLLLALPALSQPPAAQRNLLQTFTAQIARLQPQTMHPANGFIAYPYLAPGGYYPQMWDWDGFFIGLHLANQNPHLAQYLKWWVIDFAHAANPDGYVSGCITPRGPRALFGTFAMKPFLAQGAYFSAQSLHDYSWIAPLWPTLQRVTRYRETTQRDAKTGLYFWANAMQSGADNNPALTNDPKDPNAILGVDISTFQMREYLALAAIADHLHHPSQAQSYREQAAQLRSAILQYLWSPSDEIFWNRRRDNGRWVRVVSYSNFVPLIDGLLPRDQGRRMIERYLLNPNVMQSPFGFRSLSRQDPLYNNVAEINPYSNWQGPIWINANFMDWIALRRYGFPSEAKTLAFHIAEILSKDIAQSGSMHEDYNAETGVGLAPTAAESPHHRFAGFVGWNMLGEDMLQCETTGSNCITLSIQ